MALTPKMFLIVCPLVFLAGIIDAIAGGGGLISLPAYLAAGLPPYLASGTNKMANMCGTALATGKFAKSRTILWRAALPAVAGALPGSWLGARIQMMIPEKMVYIFMMAAIPSVALVMLMRRGEERTETDPTGVKAWKCLLIGFVIGMYDGLFGPGTGTFLLIAYTVLCRMDMVSANASAKVVNLSSNLAAMVTFLFHGNVLVLLAIPAALCSMAGNYIGAHLAVKKGAKVIRPIFFVVLTLLLGTVLYRFIFNQ